MSEFSITFELFPAAARPGDGRGAGGLRTRLQAAQPHPPRHVAPRPEKPTASRSASAGSSPLAALVVLCHQSTFWLFLYDVRGNVPLNFLSVLALLALIGWYYLISAMLWPDAPRGLARVRRLLHGAPSLRLVRRDRHRADRPTWPHGLFGGVRAARSGVDVHRSRTGRTPFGTLALLALPFVSHARWALGLLVLILAPLRGKRRGVAVGFPF